MLLLKHPIYIFKKKIKKNILIILLKFQKYDLSVSKFCELLTKNRAKNHVHFIIIECHCWINFRVNIKIVWSSVEQILILIVNSACAENI